ncbi:DNA gyrase inhibitor YacG [Bradyrhizobium sp. AUGA SZCCT0222]|uniref:DNA gyrase inhibitor YacG n=1 Tax=Bradyrhizobium sp. AUGA SZCCT0222 TaxID=2807668 RepID=UPI001BADE114|nr:DNA gyrase inhibitor YacG [Bradyrhizobium sp. AUGA SZCCT0222]MBR1267225.1 DNA gyrase inhibitor YacG [Bradyrhizobium sp. AUGA SZCCT0222]
MPADPPKDAGKDTGQAGSGVSKPASKSSSKPCPECGRPAENAKTLPFCSPRCRDVDLNRWLSGRYVIPGKENEAEDEE